MVSGSHEPLHDPDVDVLEDPDAHDPGTEADATAPHPTIEGQDLEDEPGTAAVIIEEEHHDAHDAHDVAEHPVESPGWVLFALAVGLVIGVVLVIIFGTGT